MRVLVLLPLLLGAALAADVSYGNSRFGYVVNVPSELTAGRPSDNGGGLSWSSPDGQVQVTAWGGNGPGVLGRGTAAQWADWTLRADVRAGARVTYRRLLPGAFVQSGYLRDGRIYYQKVLVRAGMEAGVRLTYPVSQRAVWDPRTGQIAGSLRWAPR
ncbi:hypothetical protein LAJ19_08775 [Deinococcus taeanensis]|uniref:hypothetical protein n=1 Tax=Deinococcus taeanensis TaxID=2737050 RepID=UPI001CDC8578|nr:hypothetical protein [Deinococcus taeanensis]UBV41745.1 hypothetical protein LAJ19_08775 [Deinococcus taeanensis]